MPLKTLVAPASTIKPEALGGGSIVEAKNRILINEAPRAGQYWSIFNVTFSFPQYKRNVKTKGSAMVLELRVSLFLNGIQVAEQKITENLASPQIKTIPISGVLEPTHSSFTLWGGQSLEVEYEMRIFGEIGEGAVLGTTETGTGEVQVNYDLGKYGGRRVADQR